MERNPKYPLWTDHDISFYNRIVSLLRCEKTGEEGLNNGLRHQHRLGKKGQKCWLFVPFHVKIFLFSFFRESFLSIPLKCCVRWLIDTRNYWLQWPSSRLDWCWWEILRTVALLRDKLGLSDAINNFLITLCLVKSFCASTEESE